MKIHLKTEKQNQLIQWQVSPTVYKAILLCETRELSTIIGKKPGLDSTWTGWDWTIQLVTDWIRFNNVRILTQKKKSHFLDYNNTKVLSTGILNRFQGILCSHVNRLHPINKSCVMLHPASWESYTAPHYLLGAIWCLVISTPSLAHQGPCPCGSLPLTTSYCSYSD